MNSNKYINFIDRFISESFKLKNNGASFRVCLDRCNDLNAMIKFAYFTDLIDNDTMCLLVKKTYGLLDFSDEV